MVLRRVRHLAVLIGAASLVAAGVLSPAEAARSHRIYGVVVDQYGNHPDDLFVEAIDEDGDVAASALTYASQQSDGPQHGYFFLEVPNGVYTLKFAGAEGLAGYEPAKLTDIEVQGTKAGVGSVTVLKQRPASSTSATPADTTVSTKDDVLVKAVVRAAQQVTGSVVLYVDGKVADKLGVRKGQAVLDAGRLGRGTHTLAVRYGGSSFLKPSLSRSVTVKVTKRKHR